MKFKEYYSKLSTPLEILVKENVPVDAEYGSWGSALRTGVTRRSEKETDNDTYLFKTLSETLGISIAQAVDMVKQRLFEILFPNNESNPANTENEYRQAIFDALTQVIEEIENEHNIRIRGGGSLKTWTSRIISNLATAQKTFGPNQPQARERVQPRQVRQAIERAGRDIAQNNVQQPPQPQLTDIQKLVKKTILSGCVVPVDLTPEARGVIFGIENIQEPDQNKLLEYYFLCKNILQTELANRGVKYTAITEKILPADLVQLRNSGTTRYTQRIVPNNVRYFKFSYNFLITKKVLTASTIKILQDLTSRYGITFNKVYIYLSSSDRIVFKVTGETRQNCNVLYSESVSSQTKKQIATNRKLTDGSNVLWLKYLQEYFRAPDNYRLRYVPGALRDLGITE
jgi:hypothetical protein